MNREMKPTTKLLVVDDNEWILETMYELLIPTEQAAAPKFEEMASSLFNNPAATQLAAQQEDKREITGTTTGEDALEQAERALELGEPYLVAFVDLNLERNLNGVDVAIRLRELDPKIQIVIITAYFDRRDEDQLHRELGTGNFHFLRKPFKMAAMKKLVDELCHRPSTNEHQTLQSIELSHLDDVAEPLKLSEELNRVLSQYGIRSVRFVVSDQRIVQQTLTYPDHQHSLVTDIPWVEDCSFGDLEDARKACHQVILQKSLERLNKSSGTQWASS